MIFLAYTVFPYFFPPFHPYIVIALGVVELLVFVFQHILHYSTATPYIKHSLAMLVSHLLHHTDNTHKCSHISIVFFSADEQNLENLENKVIQNTLWELVSYLLWKSTVL